MRRAIIVGGILALCLAGWNIYSRRSTRVDITANHALIFTVAWGWGMDQQLTLSHRWAPGSVAASEWIEIWKRPYNSGMAVYATQRGDRFYIGTSYKMLIVDPSQRRIVSSCDTTMIPQRTALGEQLLLRGRDSYEMIDPGGVDLTRYIRQDVPAGAVPEQPRPSRYYAGLRYLGRFGVVGPDRSVGSRGSEVRFVPAENEREPRLALQFHCG
ncbi:MAG TPA: hypothetical protein VN112_23810 [Ensifer sp.]|nr:hypothetical protein [Ensifer sp.]